MVLKKKKTTGTKTTAKSSSKSSSKLSSKKEKTSTKKSGGSSVLGRGYAGARKAKKEADMRREQSKNRLFEFWLPKDEEADIRFLTEEPITFNRHSLPNKGRYEYITCPGEGCPLCANGDYPRFVGAYLIQDKRKYTDKNGKKHVDQLKLYVQGTNVLAQLDRNSEKYGLTNRVWTVARTENAYNWDRGDEDSKESIILKKALKEFDIKDPYAIVEENVKPLPLEDLIARFGDTEDDEDDDEAEKKVNKKVKKFANL